MTGELRALGLAVEQVEGGAEFVGTMPDIWRANLWARVASRILVRLGECSATTFSALARGLGALSWADWLPPDAPLVFKVAKRHTPLFHTGRVAEAAGEALSKSLGRDVRRGSAPPQTVYLRLDGPRVSASLDTSGEHLHRRGYRTEAGPAPLRENLAAALLVRAGWKGTEPLLDPFCGSGTFPIEAALMALHVPPGNGRSFAFEKFPGFEPQQWESLRSEAGAKALRALPSPIFAADRDPEAVALTARSARRAGLAEHLHVAMADLRELEPPAPCGLLVANPPYGVRLGGEGAALRALGEALRGAFKAWRWGAILPAGGRGTGPSLGVSDSSRRSFRSGGLRLQWVQGGPEVENLSEEVRD